jgi:hypothetical protein
MPSKGLMLLLKSDNPSGKEKEGSNNEEKS